MYCDKYEKQLAVSVAALTYPIAPVEAEPELTLVLSAYKSLNVKLLVDEFNTILTPTFVWFAVPRADKQTNKSV